MSPQLAQKTDLLFAQMQREMQEKRQKALAAKKAAEQLALAEKANKIIKIKDYQ
jgi:hypothetical protein